MFERFTGQARRVVVLSQEQARLLNHGHIGTEHILLGVVAEGESAAARALADRGVTSERTRTEVEEIVGPRDSEPTTGAIPFTPRAKKVLELALREALSLGDDHIGAEHLLLAVIREREGIAVRVLNRLSVDLNELRYPLIDTLRDARIAAESSKLPRRYSSRGGTARTAEPIVRCPGCDFEATLVGAPNDIHVRIERTDRRPEFRVFLSGGDMSEQLVHECEPDTPPAIPTDEIRINEQIRARRVRLIGHDGTQYGVTTLADALQLAREQGLDLIEVAGSSAYAPVCKIMDHDTYKREQDQRRGRSGE